MEKYFDARAEAPTATFGLQPTAGFDEDKFEFLRVGGGRQWVVMNGMITE